MADKEPASGARKPPGRPKATPDSSPRQRAIADGARYYISKNACFYGHIGAHWTGSGACVECHRAASRESMRRRRVRTLGMVPA